MDLLMDSQGVNIHTYIHTYIPLLIPSSDPLLSSICYRFMTYPYKLTLLHKLPPIPSSNSPLLPPFLLFHHRPCATKNISLSHVTISSLSQWINRTMNVAKIISFNSSLSLRAKLYVTCWHVVLLDGSPRLLVFFPRVRHHHYQCHLTPIQATWWPRVLNVTIWVATLIR